MRTSIRLAVPVIATSAMLLLGACSSDSDDSGDEGGGLGQSESTGGSGSEEGSGSDGGSGSEGSEEEEGTTGGGEVPSDADVEGGWSNLEHELGLYVAEGNFSVGNVDGSVSCLGTYAEGSLDGECQDGSTFTGTATLNGDTLNVQLDTGDTYDFTRTGDLEIPEVPDM